MNWTERDLDLFKGKRQRGTKPPPAKEFDLHVLIADVLRRWASRKWRWTHLPMGEYRTPATAGRLKRMGVTSGWPDFMLFHISGRVCFLELKRRGEHQTPEQKDINDFMVQAMHNYLLTDSFTDALNWLREHEIVPARLTTSNNPSPKDKAPWSPEERPNEHS